MQYCYCVMRNFELADTKTWVTQRGFKNFTNYCRTCLPSTIIHWYITESKIILATYRSNLQSVISQLVVPRLTISDLTDISRRYIISATWNSTEPPPPRNSTDQYSIKVPNQRMTHLDHKIIQGITFTSRWLWLLA